MRDCQFSRGLRTISTIVLSFFIWTFGGAFEIAQAISNSKQSEVSSKQNKDNSQQSTLSDQPSAPADQPKAGKPEEKFQKTVNEIEQIIETVQKSGSAEEQKSNKENLRNKKSELETLDIEIRKQFKTTEDKIKDFPEVIKQRHRAFTDKYEANLKELRDNLDAIDKAKDKAETDTAIDKAKAHFEKVRPPKKKSTLDPNKLPHRAAESGKVVLEEITPSQAKVLEREYAEAEKYALSPMVPEPKGIQVASIGSLAGILTSTVLQTTTPPTPADLAETIEVKFTPAITAKAAELKHNPLKIYEYVRNNIEYVPTYGSIQGADMCLQTKLCNDFDTANLLIALLRASGIHAKYASGTIQLPIEKVKNWVGGFTDSMEALRLLASAGLPTKGLTVGGQIKYVQLEHIWVEAYIDYIPSRGSRHKTGQGDTWIRLDASFKQYAYTQGMDIQSEVPFDAQAFIDQLKNTATINETQGYVTNINSLLIQQTMTDYQTQVQNHITQNYPNATVGDVLGKKEIIKQEFPMLAGTLPYKRIVTGAKYSSLPDSLRHSLTFEVYKDEFDEVLGTKISVTKSLPELAGKRISLNYVPATDADKALIDSYVQIYASSIPAYLVNLKAELKIENTVIATGPALSMGTDQILNLTFTSPKKSEIETHLMVAGDCNVIGLNAGGVRTILESRLAQSDFTDHVSEMLYQTILSYWTEYDTLSELNASPYNVAVVRLPSEGLASAPVNIKYIFGSPWLGYYASRGLDVRRDINIVSALDGDKETTKAFNESIGMTGSFFEGLIFDQLFKNQSGSYGMSTTRILNLANTQGIPIFYITQDNLNSILPNLEVSNDVIIDIQNAVNSGKEVAIPKTNITEGNWTGTGFIISDPTTGNAGYMISSGTAGGVFMYAADMYAVLAVDETPFSPGILNSVNEWMGLVGPAGIGLVKTRTGIDFEKMMEEALRKAEEEAASQAGRKASSLLALRVLAIASLTAYFLLDVLKTDIDDDFWPFRHYTKPESKTAILSSADKCIWASTIEPLDLGPGTYVTDLRVEPDGLEGLNTALLSKELNMQDKSKLQAYIEMWIDIKRVILVNGAPTWKHQYVRPFLPICIDGKTVILSH